MPDRSEIVESEQSAGTGTTQEHSLSFLLQKVIGHDQTSNLTEEQINEVLAQRRQITTYIHEDRKRESYDSKFNLIVILVFILIFSGGVLWKYPDAFSEVLSLLIGLFGGAFGGYGYGKKQQ